MGAARFLAKAIFLGFLPNLAICLSVGCEQLPRSYGLCVACHARDIVNWLLGILGLKYLSFGIFLTSLGILAGSLLASIGECSARADERKSDPLSDLLTGFAVALGAMLAGMCQSRMVMLLAWMDPSALLVLLGVIMGALLWKE